MNSGIGLVPLRNFGIVREGLYRSAQPQYGYEYEWLKKTLGIQHIINLRKESRHDTIYAPSHGIEVTNIDVADHNPPSYDQADLFTQLLLRKVPTLFHCEHGHGRTSTFSVIAKVHAGQTLDQAVKDEEDRFHYQFKHLAQIDFLRKYYQQG